MTRFDFGSRISDLGLVTESNDLMRGRGRRDACVPLEFNDPTRIVDCGFGMWDVRRQGLTRAMVADADVPAFPSAAQPAYAGGRRIVAQGQDLFVDPLKGGAAQTALYFASAGCLTLAQVVTEKLALAASWLGRRLVQTRS